MESLNWLPQGGFVPLGQPHSSLFFKLTLIWKISSEFLLVEHSNLVHVYMILVTKPFKWYLVMTLTFAYIWKNLDESGE